MSPQAQTAVVPVLKWAGGKRQILEELSALMPKDAFGTYCEPFLGGGAMLFSLMAPRAIASDINQDLMEVYRVVKDGVQELIGLLEGMKAEYRKNPSDHFYEVRGWDRDRAVYLDLSPVQKAARTIYLNRTCYNGLYRVNANGEFNAPFGRYKNPDIVNAAALKAMSFYLNMADIDLLCEDYATTLARVGTSDFVYMDPPYDPLSATSNFTEYANGGFHRPDQVRLKENCDGLDARGVRFMLSNSSTEFIRDLYAKYNVTVIRAKRSVNSKGEKRGEVDELVIRNYD